MIGRRGVAALVCSPADEMNDTMHDIPHPEVVQVAPPPPADAPSFTGLVDLASELVGGRAVATNDDFFASVDNLVRASAPVFVEGRYTDRGKWMDGWESRRRREPGDDWAILRLGSSGHIHGFDVDTSFFTGNMPDACTLHACYAPTTADDAVATADVEWVLLAQHVPLGGGCHNYVEVPHQLREQRFTHVRIIIHPDGGVARLHAYGLFTCDVDEADELVDLACVTHGARALDSSDDYFSDRGNLILPGPSRNMGEGWETKRRRGVGHDWIVVQLGMPGIPHRVTIDTAHFKGNYPDTCELHGAVVAHGTYPDPAHDSGWELLLDHTKLQADSVLEVEAPQLHIPDRPITHVRLRIHPDGGVARLRVWCAPVRSMQ
jgi:allantoicase